MPTPVNHPPAPVLESVDVAIHPEADCAALKAKYGVVTGTHGNNKKGGGFESHHVLQNAAMRNAAGARIISTYSGHAVMLQGGSWLAGSEHDIANKHQAVRARDAAKAANPRPTFGQIKQWAKHDLTAAFQHGKPSRGMTDKEAEMLADCITTEAIDALQEYRKDNDERRLNDDNRVTNPRGCFVRGTRLWTPRGLRSIEALELGEPLLGPAGAQPLTRVDRCFDDIVELELADECLRLSVHHRLQLADGRLLPAVQLRPGHRLATHAGAAATVLALRSCERDWIFALGVSAASVAFIGRAGVAVELVDSGPPQYGHVDVRELAPFVGGLESAHA